MAAAGGKGTQSQSIGLSPQASFLSNTSASVAGTVQGTLQNPNSEGLVSVSPAAVSGGVSERSKRISGSAESRSLLES